jgi:uncharacterized protein (TIGR02266 family)
LKVLFVEDSDFYLQFRQGFFGRLGCLILNARGAEAALESCETEKPDLAVVSSRLPDGDGAELCRKLRERYRKRAPRLILMAAPEERHAGPAAWEERLERPVDPEALMARISGILDIPLRRFPRVRIQLPVSYGSRRDRLTGTAQNLSPDGMFIDSPVALEVGTRIELEFSLPGRRGALRTTAEVVRLVRLAGGRRHGLGVRFVDPDAAVIEPIAAFLG